MAVAVLAVCTKETALAATVAEMMVEKVTRVVTSSWEATANPRAGASRAWARVPASKSGCQWTNPATVCINSPIPRVTRMALAIAAEIL